MLNNLDVIGTGYYDLSRALYDRKRCILSANALYNVMLKNLSWKCSSPSNGCQLWNI